MAAIRRSGDQSSAVIAVRMSGGMLGVITLGRRFPVADSCWTEVVGTAGYERLPFLWASRRRAGDAGRGGRRAGRVRPPCPWRPSMARRRRRGGGAGGRGAGQPVPDVTARRAAGRSRSAVPITSESAGCWCDRLPCRCDAGADLDAERLGRSGRIDAGRAVEGGEEAVAGGDPLPVSVPRSCTPSSVRRASTTPSGAGSTAVAADVGRVARGRVPDAGRGRPVATDHPSACWRRWRGPSEGSEPARAVHPSQAIDRQCPISGSHRPGSAPSSRRRTPPASSRSCWSPTVTSRCRRSTVAAPGSSLTRARPDTTTTLADGAVPVQVDGPRGPAAMCGAWLCRARVNQEAAGAVPRNQPAPAPERRPG